MEDGTNVFDSDFRGGVEFDLGNNSQLNLQTLVFNKNKTIFFMIYPRIYYTLPFRFRFLNDYKKKKEDTESVDHVGSTQLEAACSIGASSRRMMFGLSHILTDSITTGYNFQINTTLQK